MPIDMNTPDDASATPEAAPTADTPDGQEQTKTPKKVIQAFRQKIEAAKRNSKQHHGEWKRNVELRIGRVGAMYTGGLDVENELQVELNPDWSLTKTKVANLFSQVPRVGIEHLHKKYVPAVTPLAKALNYEIGAKRANVGACMEECLNDVVNAAGVGVAIVGWSARFEDRLMPINQDPTQPPVPNEQLMDVTDMHPDQQAVMQQSGMVPAQPVPHAVSSKFYCERVSPFDFLSPVEFTKSDFDAADWVGYRGRCSGPDAKYELRLSPEQIAKALSASVSDKSDQDLRSMPEQKGLSENEVITYDRIFYWRHRVDPEEKNFKSIWVMTFVDGCGEMPVIDEPWTGQQFDKATGKYIGACRFPIRVLTLTYISDNPIPPSDSRAGRPQTNDLRRSRSQMFQNRDRSIPIRWYDTNRIDEEIAATLRRGTWQGFIPTNGSGEKAIGEVARASYPSENDAFDVRTKQDLLETWRLGPNQSGTATPADTTKAEVDVIQSNFATMIGQERSKVANFFLGICDVMTGLMALYSDFEMLEDDERQQMQQAWDNKHILHDLAFNIRPDSTVMVDTQAQLQRIYKFIDMNVKSGFVNPMPLMIKAIELSGIDLDPQEVIKPPQPPPDPKPRVSFSFTGKDDLNNALVLAILLKNGEGPDQQFLQQAETLLGQAQSMGLQRLDGMPQQTPGAPAGGPPGAPPPGGPLPQGQTENQDWNSASTIVRRSEMGE